MIDGLFEGLLGGIFGPPLAQILGRYKYWIVFLTGFLAVPIVTTIQGVWTLGWKLFFFPD